MGATSVLFYVIVYGLTNLGAFGVVAALSSRAGGDDMEDFNGMARRAPLLSLLMLIFVLSLAGYPAVGWDSWPSSTCLPRRSSTTTEFRAAVAGGARIFMSAVSLYYYLILSNTSISSKAPTKARSSLRRILMLRCVLSRWQWLDSAFTRRPILELLNSLIAAL